MIILLRHGKTIANENRIVLGQRDSKLTREGIQTCEKISKILNTFSNTQIISSPLNRAVTSSMIISRYLKIPVKINHDLKELCCGCWQDQKRDRILPGKKPLRKNWDFYPPGGESYSMAEIRIKRFINNINQQMNIIIIGHAAVNLVFIKLWLNLSVDEAMTFIQPHNRIYFIENRNSIKWIDTDMQRGKGFKK